MFWALENPGRFLRERSVLEILCGEVGWIKSLSWRMTVQLELKVDVDLIVGENVFEVELVYPELFPDAPAFVRPRSSTDRWSSHQYGSSGILCLEWGPDNWTPEITGSDLLCSCYKLLSIERDPSTEATAVPSRHRLTLGQEVRTDFNRLIVSTALSDLIRTGSENQSYGIVTHWMYHESTRVLFVSELSSGCSDSIRINDLPSGIVELGPWFTVRGEGWLFKSDEFDLVAPFSSLDSLFDAIQRAGFSDFALHPLKIETPSRPEYYILLIGKDGRSRAYAVDIREQGSITEYTVIGLNDRTVTRIPPELLDLSSHRVGIVGLGSVGSKVAISLARSGVKKFVLVDDDVMLQGNVCRNELDWTSVGVNKVNAVRDSLSMIATGIEVEVRRTRLAGQESSQWASAVLNELAACDILIDATASPSVFVQLATIAKRRSKSLVWGEVFAGGIGALLARSRPNKDPDPHSMRAGIHSYLQTQPEAPFKFGTDYDNREDGEHPVLATDSDVSHLAASLTSMVLDTLSDTNPSRFPDSAYLIGLKRAWIFSAPFDTRPIAVPSLPTTVTTTSAEDREIAVGLLSGLLTDHAQVNADPTT